MIRFGIIGTGRIAKRFIKELEHVDGVSVSCVYNPHIGSAKRFVKDLQDIIPLENIEEMWEKVDAVYIASPHETHGDYTIKCLECNKHVLCEKPMALESKEAIKAFDLARKNNLLLMEGLKTAYMPGFKNLCEVAKSGVIGEVSHVSATFTKLVPKDSREYTDSKAAGSFLELGSYGMLAVFKLLGLDYESVSFDKLQNVDGVDIFAVANFKFVNTIASVTTGIGVKSDGRLVVSGTKGYIVAPAPWWLTRHFEVHFEDPSKVISYDEKLDGDGLRYEIKEFVSMINEKNFSKEMEDLSLAMVGVMEQYRTK